MFLIIIFTVNILYSEKIYTVLSRGSVKDNSTGLTWTRCSMTANDKPDYDFNCNGKKKLYSWDMAVNACLNLKHEGRSDWRLPSVRELQSILFYHHYSGDSNKSQIMEQVFPNVMNSYETISNPAIPLHYWSSTIHANSSNFAWFVDFYNGNTAFAWRTTSNEKKAFVRCVAGP